MLGLSVSKLIFTVLAIAVVWYGWRWIARLQARHRVEHERRMMRETSPRPRSRSAPAATKLRPCPICGAYVEAEHATPCGRVDCPFPG